MSNLEQDLCVTEWLIKKVRQRDDYAQNLYAALCNQRWQKDDVWEILRGDIWSCSWRSAGGIVADIRGQEETYMDWYCSGMMYSHPDDGRSHSEQELLYVPEGTVTQEIRQDLAALGWYPVVDQ